MNGRKRIYLLNRIGFKEIIKVEIWNLLNRNYWNHHSMKIRLMKKENIEKEDKRRVR